MARSLVIAGSLLFLLGLLQGGLVGFHYNPRMALSAHLAAVQSGMALMVAGAVWPLVRLSQKLGAGIRWGLIASMFGLWLALTLSALTGASAQLQIAGRGYSAGPLAEALVSVLILLSSGVMIAAWAGLVWGLCRRQGG